MRFVRLGDTCVLHATYRDAACQQYAGDDPFEYAIDLHVAMPFADGSLTATLRGLCAGPVQKAWGN
jgi:hypothetical protein